MHPRTRSVTPPQPFYILNFVHPRHTAELQTHCTVALLSPPCALLIFPDSQNKRAEHNALIMSRAPAGISGRTHYNSREVNETGVDV